MSRTPELLRMYAMIADGEEGLPLLDFFEGYAKVSPPLNSVVPIQLAPTMAPTDQDRLELVTPQEEATAVAHEDFAELAQAFASCLTTHMSKFSNASPDFKDTISSLMKQVAEVTTGNGMESLF